MKKHFSTVVIAILMTVLMVALSPVQTFAASRKQYVSDICMSDSIEKLENLGYTVLDQDLNAGTSWYDVTELKTHSEYSYIGYKTTTNPDEAITDISIMDMKGGYSFGDYEEILKQQEDEISTSIGMFRDMLKEFVANYRAGSPAAQKAYTALNNYIEDDSGKLVGDLFLDENLSDADLIKIYMQSNMLVLYCLQTAVTVGLANYKSDNLLEKLSTLGPVYTTTDYYDEAIELFDSLDSLREALSSYLNVGFDLEDSDAIQKYLDECNEEDAADYSQNAMLYNLLDSYKYGDSGMTLAEFFMLDEIEVEDLFPLVSVMTKGQYAAARLNGFLTLFISAENDAEIYAEAQQNLPEDIKETVEHISIYTGIDRSMYKGGVAITSEVKRKSSSTGDTSWAYGNVDNRIELALFITAGISALTAMSFFGMGTFLYNILPIINNRAIFSMFIYKIIVVLDKIPITRWIARSFLNQMSKGAYIWSTVGGIIMYASMAILAITVIVYFSMEIYGYYNPEYTEIPLILLDLKFGESDEVGDWEKYVRYDVVHYEDDDDKAGDLNCFMGKQWNAMYVTKDRAAGNPIEADSFKVQYGDSTTPRNSLPVHYFGSGDAFNLNSHCFNDEVGGIFMFFRGDDKAFASETASVFGTGALAAVTGIGGLIIGALGAVIVTKKKKEPAAVTETK